jgi:hypothetical protein
MAWVSDFSVTQRFFTGLGPEAGQTPQNHVSVIVAMSCTTICKTNSRGLVLSWRIGVSTVAQKRVKVSIVGDGRQNKRDPLRLSLRSHPGTLPLIVTSARPLFVVIFKWGDWG